MSLLNKNGQYILSGTSSCSTITLVSTYSTYSGATTLGTWGGSSIKFPNITYYVLGEYIEVESYLVDTSSLIVAISTLNILGKPFYDELKKNGFVFPHEIEEYLVIKFKILQRDSKINDILD